MSIKNQQNQFEGQGGTEQQSFLEKYQNIIVGVVVGILVIVIGVLAYQNLYLKPRNTEAINAIYAAEQQFEKDSFENALLSPGAGNMGFLDIIDEYSGTPTANLAKYYAGVSYMKLGKFEVAISYLEEFAADGNITPITKYGLLGDAYSELGDFAKAKSFYKKAGNTGDNTYLTPYYLKKLGMLHERDQEYKEALAAYKEIKEKYPESPDGYGIEKYISNIEFKDSVN
ncbi:tetratricopeptide repeat protein [Membranihabitans maritimus]|uniref:tetratricopeptide repeat protein n=1 Tax=Membranihabitans maritimus TaxID=2904244 RepID=UPI001F37F2F9|nr:tetratricopeptide repeat protein [Membranihabitans maritimus]